MPKKYTGSLSLDWYNKQKSILIREAQGPGKESDIPAPRINWINKDEALFYEISPEEGKGLQPYWVDRNDLRVKEARPLIHQKTYRAVPADQPGTLAGTAQTWTLEETDEDDPTVENLLIKGDNLLALNTLKKLFDQKPDEEKVQCVYIDPPYNIGKAFEAYDDNLAHSEWLSLIRDRLAIIKGIMKESGVIFIHIDDTELAYLKALMDELFGRDNFVANFVWETDGNFDNQAKVKIAHEYILLYAKDKSLFPYPPVIDPNISDTSKLFKPEIVNTIVKNGPKNPPSEIQLPKRFPASFESGVIKARENAWPHYFEDVIVEDFKVVNSVAAYSGWSSKTLAEEFIDNGFTSVLDSKNQITKFYLTQSGAIEARKKRSEDIGYVISILRNMGNTQSMGSQLSQIGIPFDYPKPESLSKYLLEICSEEGDIVLDCFGGSGTTFAVAQKLSRTWIGIEIGNHADTRILPRLRLVLEGKDKIGISPSINWQGGGAFKYYHLGPSIIQLDAQGVGDFNWDLGQRFLEESLLSTYDFVVDPDFQLDGQLFQTTDRPAVGFLTAGNQTMAGIATLAPPSAGQPFLSFDQIMYLYRSIHQQRNPRAITLFTNRGIEIALDAKPQNLEIIKVPQAIFADLER